MDATPTRGARKAPAARPTFEKISALAMEKAEEDLKVLVGIRRTDRDWQDTDRDVEHAVELSLSQIRAMRETKFKDCIEFRRAWLKAGSPINLASRTFSRTGCAYERCLKNASHMFAQLVEFVEFAV